VEKLVKLGQLKRKITKEFAKSPAKTVILIALCPVALYFLVPLCMPAKPIDEARRAKVITPNFVPSATALASTSPVSSFGPGPTWTELNGWIEADRRRMPGTVAMDQRDPFQAPAVSREEGVAVDTIVTEQVTWPTVSQEAFAAMGLKLTGTVMGRNSRSATINGRRYQAGEIVTPMARERSANGSDYVFTLEDIGPLHAILEMDGARFRLELRPMQPVENGITVVRMPANSSH
jgi:hypothetical protein